MSGNVPGLRARQAAGCDYNASMSDTLSAALSGLAVPDPHGREIPLGSLWQAVPAVLVFLRHCG